MMKIHRRCGGAVLLLGLALPAGSALAACEDATTTVEMTACMERNYRAADQALNGAYKSAMGAMRETTKILQGRIVSAGAARPEQLLLEAQRRWVSFRDAQCALERSMNAGGSIAILAYYGCLTGMTEARTAKLEEMAAGPEGPEGIVESPR